MAQNRFLTAAENLWDAVTVAKGPEVTLIVKRVFYRSLEVPHLLPLRDPVHPMQIYSRGTLESIRARMRETFSAAITNEDALNIIDELTQTGDSDLFVLMTTVLIKYRQWRSVLAELE
jgi:hypothetical protein